MWPTLWVSRPAPSSRGGEAAPAYRTVYQVRRLASQHDLKTHPPEVGSVFFSHLVFEITPGESRHTRCASAHLVRKAHRWRSCAVLIIPVLENYLIM